MPKIVDKEAKKKDILLAALGLFANKGVKNTKMTEIAFEANIGKGTIYEYFSSKDEIFHASEEMMMEEVQFFIEKGLKKATCPEEKIRAFVFGAIDALESHSEVIKIHLDFWAEGLRSDGLNEMIQTYQKMHTTLTAFIQEGIDSKIFRASNAADLAWGLAAMMDGLLFQKCVFGDDFELHSKAENTLNLLLNGLKNEEQ